MTLYTVIFTLSSELKLYCEYITVCVCGFSGSVFVVVVEGTVRLTGVLSQTKAGEIMS